MIREDRKRSPENVARLHNRRVSRFNEACPLGAQVHVTGFDRPLFVAAPAEFDPDRQAALVRVAGVPDLVPIDSVRPAERFILPEDDDFEGGE